VIGTIGLVERLFTIILAGGIVLVISFLGKALSSAGDSNYYFPGWDDVFHNLRKRPPAAYHGKKSKGQGSLLAHNKSILRRIANSLSRQLTQRKVLPQFFIYYSESGVNNLSQFSTFEL
jgi:hypothetical protein